MNGAIVLGLAAASLVVSSLVTRDARAQSQSGFAVNRFEPAERGSQLFVVDTLDIREGARALGAVLDYAYKPLVIYDARGDERAALVRHQTFVRVGGSFIVLERLRLGLDVPVAIYQDGEPIVVSGARLGAADAPAFGDVRLAADVRVLGAPQGPFTLAAGVRGWLPTGLRSQLTSDGSMRAGPQIMASGVVSVVTWAARLALVYRARDDEYAGRALGSEISGAIGGGLRTRDGRLVVGPELQAASAFTGGATFLGERETPVDWTFGAHYDVVPSVRVGAGIGGGIGHGYGSPLVRGLASIEWIAARPPLPPGREHVPEERTPWEGTEDGTAETSAPPLATITDESEIHILGELRFATGSADLVPSSSDDVLAAVKRLLDEHPEIHRLRVEGHTDAIGDAAYNDDLSARRAKAVEAWLVAHGIEQSRLESVGVGSRAPIDTDDTDDARARNRRVIFRIVERE